MRDRIARCAARLAAGPCAEAGAIGIAALDDAPIAEGEPALARLALEVLSRLGCLGVVAARPALPFADFLVRRASPGESSFAPRDAETRSLLHEIPFLRRDDLGRSPAGRIARLLERRKAIVAEGIGIVAAGGWGIEQAAVHWSAAFHAVFVKYLLDLHGEGFRLPEETATFRAFRERWLAPPGVEGLSFRPGPMEEPEEILEEIAAVGRHTVARGLVDSVFGNISYRKGNVVYISRTGAALDELTGEIDPVPDDDSSTAGMTASSELPAHRRIYEATGARAILHGHPRFAVVMSMLCEEEGCVETECATACRRVRYLGDAPVVAGESGAGGLARTVPAVIGRSGRAVVYGHGVFAVGMAGFADPFRALAEVESRCRRDYFRRIDGGR